MRKILIAVVALAAMVVGGTWIYTVVDKPAPKLTIDSTAASDTSTTVATDDGTTEGTWKVSRQSIVQYRVNETLFGARNEATGKTSSVTGSIAVAGTSVTDGSFTVDMDSISSDRAQRDGQFRGRIMNTSQFPTATFDLTTPIALKSVEPDEEITASATGELTLHGVTRKVSFTVRAKRVTGQIRANGSIPIHFADYDIDNPSGGPAQVGDDGTLEFTLVFTR